MSGTMQESYYEPFFKVVDQLVKEPKKVEALEAVDDFEFVR
jgi:hypothetical protein